MIKMALHRFQELLQFPLIVANEEQRFRGAFGMLDSGNLGLLPGSVQIMLWILLGSYSCRAQV